MGDPSEHRCVRLVLATSTGGVGQHVRSLVQRLPGLGWDVEVIGPPATDRLFRFTAAAAGFRPIDIAASPRPVPDVRAVAELRRALPGADVVHAHGLRAAAFAGLALGRRRPSRVPLVATWHNAVLGGGPRRALLARLERLAARRADITLGASGDLVARAHAVGAPDARLAPVAAPPMPPAVRQPTEVLAELAAGDRPMLLAVGRLAPQKDYGTLLSAAEIWREHEPVPLVVVVGDGPLLEDLRHQADARQLPVRFLGRRNDIADLLGAADAYVLTSAWEARALVVQEAMRAGVPVVATAVGGIPELTGDAALLVPPHDPTAVAAAVSRLLGDPDLARELAGRGLKRAAGWPDEDDTASSLAALYDELLRPGC